MQNKLCLFLSIAVWSAVETAPATTGLGALEFDALDTDLKDLKYEVEEEDLDDYAQLLDDAEKSTNDQNKKSVNTSAFKNKNISNNGSKAKHTVADLKKFFKTTGAHDQGAYDDDDLYALAEAFAGKGVAVKGNEDRKYRKGTKTRGFHRVHHKDEYKKDKIFYEDDETNSTIKKIGAKGYGYKVNAGAGYNKGHFRHDRQKGRYGKHGFLDEGYSDKDYKDFSDSEGFDGTFSSER